MRPKVETSINFGCLEKKKKKLFIVYQDLSIFFVGRWCKCMIIALEKLQFLIDLYRLWEKPVFELTRIFLASFGNSFFWNLMVFSFHLIRTLYSERENNFTIDTSILFSLVSILYVTSSLLEALLGRIKFQSVEYKKTELPLFLYTHTWLFCHSIFFSSPSPFSCINWTRRNEKYFISSATFEFLKL